jgi:Carboxypeptidase regulatory-like domain
MTTTIKARAEAIGRIVTGLVVVLMSTAIASHAAGSPRAKTKPGAIEGTVRLEGVPPQLPPLNIDKDQDFCKNVPNEALVLGPDKGIKNVVAALVDVPKATAEEGPPPTAVYRLTNVGCRFVPHVIVMQFDKDLEISNEDPILHTAKAIRSQLDIGLFPGRVMRKPMGAPTLGPVKVTCEIHRWMLGWVFLTDNPYYAVTDAYGRYEIEDVPPGKYKLEFWHELFGMQEKEVKVAAGRTTELNFKFRAANAQIR